MMIRVGYLHEEDVKIVKYLADREAWAHTNGNHVWKMMEENRVLPQRTFQSLRNRFLKSIKPRLLTEFSSLINVRQLPRHFKNSLPQAHLLKAQLETEHNTLENRKRVSRKENVSPQRPESPSLVQRSPRVNLSKNVADVVVDSSEIDGWTVPHCAAIRDTNIPKTGEQPRKRKIYNGDSDDLFEDEEEEPIKKKTLPENEPLSRSKAQEEDLLNEARLGTASIEALTQEPLFMSLYSINRDTTQIVPAGPPEEEDQEPTHEPVPDVTSKTTCSAILKKKRKRNYKFQRIINNLSTQFAKVHRKQQLELNSLRRKLIEERRKNQQTEAVAEIPEIVAQVSNTSNEPVLNSDRPPTLLQNMLKSLDEDTRKNIMGRYQQQ